MYPVPGCPLVKRGAPGLATGASTNGKMAAYDATAMLIRCNSNPNISRSRQACIRMDYYSWQSASEHSRFLCYS
ncbi:unnamed protein product [Sphagnum jensenii]|uniref:Uncharacterized protein n=1 Tax=Sphagnum jensenii TaxID=128206 RepID=A0ABP1A5G6_9BRYO